MGEYMEKITSYLRWISLIFLFAITGGCLALYLIFRSSKKAQPMLQACCRLYARHLGAKVEIIGEKNIELKNAVVLFNHNSFMDHFVVVGSLNALVFGIEKVSNYKIPLYGYISKKWGNIGIDRSNREQSLEALEELKKRLQDGGNLIIAPEGTRKPVGELKPFKKGGFYFADQTGADIIPITLIGMADLNPDGKFLLRPRKIYMHIGKVESSKGLDVDQLRDKYRKYYEDKIKELGEQGYV